MDSVSYNTFSSSLLQPLHGSASLKIYIFLLFTLGMMILVDLINFVICLLPLLIFITLVLVLNLITTYNVN